VFAAVLNVGKATVAAWEQGGEEPSGPSLKLLDAVERKGLPVWLESSGQGEIVRRGQDRNPSPGMHRKQVAHVAAHDDIRSTGRRQHHALGILWIAASPPSSWPAKAGHPRLSGM